MTAIRTDLAIECREMFAGEISGVESGRRDEDKIKVTDVRITTEDGARQIGKPMGNYVTIEIDELNMEDSELVERGAEVISKELKKLLLGKNADSVLVVGLGNQYITPDSIGPKTAGKITVTRHITKEAGEGFDFDVRAVSAVAPGVLGITGIETGEIIKGIIDRTKPTVIIAVDALAARNIKRLGTTLQLSDTGICPGSGVGNNRKELSEKTLGIPVIAIGIPMVVDAVTLAQDLMGNSSEENNKFSGMYSANCMNMIVTPNDVDVISEQASDIIADGINMAMHT